MALNPSESVDKLDTLPVTVLKGVGPRVAARLERLRILTVQDVLFHLPLRYEDRTRVSPMGSVRPGEQVVVEPSHLGSDLKMPLASLWLWMSRKALWAKAAMLILLGSTSLKCVMDSGAFR